MNIAVFGANGNIGRRVVVRLLAKGHTVTALTHGRSNLPQHQNLMVISGDIYNMADVEKMLTHADIVISTLGSWGTKRKDILTAGMKNIIPAMNKLSIQRIVSLTGSGVLLPGDQLRWYDYLNPLLLELVAPKILADGKNHIDLLTASQLDWTVIRSPVMTNGTARSYTFETSPPLPWKRIPRDTIADAIVDLAESGSHLQSAPFIHA